MKGLGGRRGPLKPGMSFRLRMALAFLLIIPASMAVFSLIRVWLDRQSIEQGFLSNWLMWTPLLWGLVFGDVIGRRISSAVGYHRSEVFGRLAELVFVLTCFALCGVVAAILYPPGGAFLPVIGVLIFLTTGAVGFGRGMIAK